MNHKTSHENTKPSNKTLNYTLTKASLTAVISGMAAYTFFEYVTSGEFDAKELVIHHIIPTVFIGAIVWSMLNLILLSKFVKPMKSIMTHLNGVGDGRLAPLKLDTNILEVGAIIHSVNTLTTQLKKAPDNEGAGKAVDDLVKLRADLKKLIDSTHIAPDQLVPIMRDLKNLEGHLLSAITADRQAHTDLSHPH